MFSNENEISKSWDFAENGAKHDNLNTMGGKTGDITQHFMDFKIMSQIGEKKHEIWCENMAEAFKMADNRLIVARLVFELAANKEEQKHFYCTMKKESRK